MQPEDLLDSTDTNLLYQIYQVSLVPQVAFTDLKQGGLPLYPFIAGAGVATKAQLDMAIAYTNNIQDSDERKARVAAIRKILAAYQDFNLDPSSIDKDGYSFRAKANFKATIRELFPYTGLAVEFGAGSNRTPIG